MGVSTVVRRGPFAPNLDPSKTYTTGKRVDEI